MIQTNELRIGNKVFYDGVPVCVKAIAQYPAITYVSAGSDKQDCYEISPEEYDPIPLTPEILKKCGFNQTMAKVDTWWKGDLQIQLDSNFWWRIDADTDDDGSIARAIYFLHQLQNLYFALTNNELEIKL